MTDMQTIVITVNCKGVMGKGIALRLKKTAKPAYDYYRDLCDNGKMNLGTSVIYDEPIDALNGKTILFFPTKFHWGNKSELFQIKNGLKHFAKNYDDMKIKSIAFPALGCGNGQLNWDDVKPLMYKYLEDLDIEIEIYEPGEQIEKIPNSKSPKITDYS